MPEYRTPCYTIQNSRPCRARSGRHIRTQLRCYEPRGAVSCRSPMRSEEHTSELQSRGHLVCRLLLEKKKKHKQRQQLIKKIPLQTYTTPTLQPNIYTFTPNYNKPLTNTRIIISTIHTTSG